MAGNSSERLEELQYKREQARLGGGLKRQESIRSSGRGTARDRIAMLLDENSFVEIDAFVTQNHGQWHVSSPYTSDGVVAGHGANGRRIYCLPKTSASMGSVGNAR